MSVVLLLIVLAIGFAAGVWWSNARAPQVDPEGPARKAAQMRTEDRLHIAELIRRRRKIDAIRETRERIHCGLAEAKAIVDHLEANDPATGIG